MLQLQWGRWNLYENLCSHPAGPQAPAETCSPSAPLLHDRRCVTHCPAPVSFPTLLDPILPTRSASWSSIWNLNEKPKSKLTINTTREWETTPEVWGSEDFPQAFAPKALGSIFTLTSWKREVMCSCEVKWEQKNQLEQSTLHRLRFPFLFAHFF